MVWLFIQITENFGSLEVSKFSSFQFFLKYAKTASVFKRMNREKFFSKISTPISYKNFHNN